MKASQKNTYYLKIAFKNKIKKYSFSSIDQINFLQIKKNLCLNEPQKESFYNFQVVSQFGEEQSYNQCFKSQQDLVNYIEQKIKNLPNKHTIKIRIVQKIILSEEQKSRKQSFQSLQIPQTFIKKRSRSEELDIFDQGCKTEIFDITSLQTNQKGRQMRHTVQYQCQKQNEKCNIFMTKKENGVYQCLHNSLILNKKQKNQLQRMQQKIKKMIAKHKQQKRNINVKNLLNFLQQ